MYFIIRKNISAIGIRTTTRYLALARHCLHATALSSFTRRHSSNKVVIREKLRVRVRISSNSFTKRDRDKYREIIYCNYYN